MKSDSEWVNVIAFLAILSFRNKAPTYIETQKMLRSSNSQSVVGSYPLANQTFGSHLSSFFDQQKCDWQRSHADDRQQQMLLGHQNKRHNLEAFQDRNIS